MSVAQNLPGIREKIEAACRRAGRSPQEVTLIAVTKTRTPEEISQAYDCGLHVIGENRVQELLQKADSLRPGTEVHLIGQLQTNKVKYILDKVTLIHSLDRLSLAQELDHAARKRGRDPIRALVEVNIGQEPTKSGVLPADLSEYLDILQKFVYIKPMGLMTVAPATATEAEQHQLFAQMRTLLSQGQARFGSSFCELSMGMSRDYEAAIEEGATMIRLGTALFGPRNYSIQGETL